MNRSNTYFKLSALFAGTALLGSIAYAQKHTKKQAEPTQAAKSAADAPTPTTTMPPRPSSDPLMTVRQAVNIARSKNPLLAESAELANQAGEAVPVARALLFPNISGTAESNYQKASANTATATTYNGTAYNTYSAQLKMVQPLFQIGSISAIQNVEKGYDIAKLNTEIAVRDMSNQIVAAYYLLVLNNLNVDTLVRQQKIVSESLATASQRERTGRGQLLDVLQVKTQIALLEGQIATARNQADIAAAQLANFLGESQRSQFHVVNAIAAPRIEVVDKVLDLGHSRLPELERNYLVLGQLDDQREVLLGQNLPSLKANGQYGYSSPTKSDLFAGTSVNWLVGLELDIPIFSGFSYIYARRALLAQQAAAEFDKANIENTLTLQQVTSRKNLETAQDSMDTGEEALRLAVASSNEARRQYRLATIDFLQLQTIEQAHAQAEQTLNQNKFNYIQALGAYYVASGQDLNGLLELLEGGRR